MKKILFFIAIASFSTIGFTSCSEDDAVMEIPTPNKNPNVGQQLVVTPSAKFIPLGQSVTLKTYSGSTEIKDAIYYVEGREISGSTYMHTTIANVKIQAKRAGYLDSEVITVQFAQKPF